MQGLLPVLGRCQRAAAAAGEVQCLRLLQRRQWLAWRAAACGACLPWLGPAALAAAVGLSSCVVLLPLCGAAVAAAVAAAPCPGLPRLSDRLGRVPAWTAACLEMALRLTGANKGLAGQCNKLAKGVWCWRLLRAGCLHCLNNRTGHADAIGTCWSTHVRRMRSLAGKLLSAMRHVARGPPARFQAWNS